MIILLTTTPNIEEAELLAEKIIESKLAACVQILPEIKSVYLWKEGIQKEKECLMLIKTLTEKYKDLEKFIQTNHSYEIPEIVAVPAEKVSEGYFAWLKGCLEK